MSQQLNPTRERVRDLPPSVSYSSPMSKRRASVFFVAILAAGCSEAPEALNPFSSGAMSSSASFVGVTAAGEGRARLRVSSNNQGLGNGFVGVRALLSSDGGLTFDDRRPRSRYHPDPGIALVDELAAGSHVDVVVVSINNLGIESEFDAVNGLIGIDVPVTSDDVQAPDAPFLSPPLAAPGGVALQWDESNDDTYAFHVERAVDGGAFTEVARPLVVSESGYFDADVVAGSTYLWHVVSEDLSGNLSAPSDDVTLTVGF